MSEDKAGRRWLIMQFVRLGGIALIIVGFAMQTGRIDAPGWLSVIIAIVGFLSVFVAPTLLARRWKSPPQ